MFNQEIYEVKNIHLSLDEINELSSRLERSREIKLKSIKNKQLNYLDRCRDLGYRPTKIEDVKDIQLPETLQIRKEDMYNTLMTIDLSYFIKGGWYPINQTLDILYKCLIRYYKKNLKHTLSDCKEEQYKMIVFTHLYTIKNHNLYQYIKRYNPDELSKYWKPHIHCMIKLPEDKKKLFCDFMVKEIRKKYHTSSISFKDINQTTEDQINLMKYGYKFKTMFFTETDFQNKNKTFKGTY